MIVCDSSPLVAILFAESDADLYLSVLGKSGHIVMGAPSKLEASMVVGGRYGQDGIVELNLLLNTYSIEIVSWTDDLATTAIDAFMRFGKGRHPAHLNFGDCMSYAVAKDMDAPLLYKGGDFAKTDIRSAL